MRCTFYLPTYAKDMIIVQRHNDDGTWSLAEFDWLGLYDYGRQKYRFLMEGLKPYIVTDQWETTIPVIAKIAKKRMLGQLYDSGLAIERDDDVYHPWEFIEAGVWDERMIVITHQVRGRLYRYEDQEIECKVAAIDLKDWTETTDEGMIEHKKGELRYTEYCDSLKHINKSNVKRMVTRGEAREIAFKAFRSQMDDYIRLYKEYIGVME